MRTSLLALALLGAATLSADQLLIPMDLVQTDHLRAYGVTYNALKAGLTAEWLLNYRGGSFLLPDLPALRDLCLKADVACEVITAAQQVEIEKTIAGANMDKVILEKAPKVAVYAPPFADPWDDAVRLALDYAGIPYDRVWDEEVLAGKLTQYDWLHLHHEDFTGQYGKFYGSYRSTEWYQREVAANEAAARALGFTKVSRLKLAVAQAIKRYVEQGGFVFAMCSAIDTYDIALAAAGTDIVESVFDGDGVDPEWPRALDYRPTLATQGFTVYPEPTVYEHSDIDVYPQAIARGEHVYFALFDFSAKYDPVPTMLTQNHVALVKEFLGQNVGYDRDKLKKSVLILGEVAGTEEVKYIHGTCGQGTFTFLGGHDPEDYSHRVGDPPTDLRLHRDSPGYRLILNNVLFPAAEKKELKT